MIDCWKIVTKHYQHETKIQNWSHFDRNVHTYSSLMGGIHNAFTYFNYLYLKGNDLRKKSVFCRI